MVLDPALVDAIAYAFSQAPPAIVQPAASLGDADALERDLAEKMKIHEQHFSDWEARGAEARRRLSEAIVAHSDHVELLVEALDRIIIQLEAELEDYAAELRRTANYLERRAKRLASLDPRTRRIGKRAVAYYENTCERDIGARSDFVMFLRATKASLDPTSRGGKSFDSRTDLAAYLDSLVA